MIPRLSEEGLHVKFACAGLISRLYKYLTWADLFVDPSTLTGVRSLTRRLNGNLQPFSYARFMKFSIGTRV